MSQVLESSPTYRSAKARVNSSSSARAVGWWPAAAPSTSGELAVTARFNVAMGGSFPAAFGGGPTGATQSGVPMVVDYVAAYTSGGGGTPPPPPPGGGTITGPGGKCVDVSGDDTGGNGVAVQLWDCQSFAVDQHWTHNSDNSLSTLGRCLDINGNGTAQGTKVELWDCNGVGGQKWVQQADGSLRNPQSGRCLDSPSGATANGTRLQIWDCNGSAAQRFPLS